MPSGYNSASELALACRPSVCEYVCVCAYICWVLWAQHARLCFRGDWCVLKRCVLIGPSELSLKDELLMKCRFSHLPHWGRNQWERSRKHPGSPRSSFNEGPIKDSSSRLPSHPFTIYDPFLIIFYLRWLSLYMFHRCKVESGGRNCIYHCVILSNV